MKINTSLKIYYTKHPPSFEESNVEDGGVVVNKLKKEHLKREGVLILRVCSGSLCNVHDY